MFVNHMHIANVVGMSYTINWVAPCLCKLTCTGKTCDIDTAMTTMLHQDQLL